MIFGKIPALKHGAIPMALCSFLLGEWPALFYYTLLITLETGMAETRDAHSASSSTWKKNRPWVNYKKLLNAMSKTEFNNYRDIEVMRIKDKGEVISKGYYKLEYLMSSLSSVPGRVLELGGGAGGMTQFLVAHKNVKTVDVLNYDREGHGKHRLEEVRTTGYGKSHITTGDVHDFQREKDYDLILSDIGESKSDFQEKER